MMDQPDVETRHGREPCHSQIDPSGSRHDEVRAAWAGKAIGSAALILMLANLSSSLIGFMRQAVIAHVFGAGMDSDAFYAASIVPQMFYDLTIGAAVSAALIPTFSSIVKLRDKEALTDVAGSVLALAWIVLAATVVLLVVFAHPFMAGIAAMCRCATGSAELNRTVEVLRVLLPSLFFLGTSAVLLATLYSVQRFTAPAFAGMLYHAGIILGAVLLVRPLGVLALPVGAVVGAAGQAMVQVPALVRNGIMPRPRLGLTPEVRRILRLYLPVAAGLLVSIVGQIIDLGFKWKLGKARLTDMQFATTLTQFPIGIAVAALSFAVLPALSADAALNRMDDFKDSLVLGIRVVLFLTIPAALGYLVLATPIVSLVYQSGHLTVANVSRTAAALTGYAIQIPFVGIDQLMIFAFYARKNTITPMLVGVLGVGIYVAGAYILIPRLNIFGLALANTIQNTAHAAILLALLLLSIGKLDRRGLSLAVVKIGLAGAVMAGGAVLLLSLMSAKAAAGGFAAHALLALPPLLLGAGLYVGTAALLKSQEIELLLGLLRRRMTR